MQPAGHDVTHGNESQTQADAAKAREELAKLTNSHATEDTVLGGVDMPHTFTDVQMSNLETLLDIATRTAGRDRAVCHDALSTLEQALAYPRQMAEAQARLDAGRPRTGRRRTEATAS